MLKKESMRKRVCSTQDLAQTYLFDFI